MNKKQQDIINNTSEGISNKYALCIVDVNNLGTRTFSYLIPEHLKSTQVWARGSLKPPKDFGKGVGRMFQY